MVPDGDRAFLLLKDRIPFSEHDQDGEPLPPLCANRNFFHVRGFELLLNITLGPRLPSDAPLETVPLRSFRRWNVTFCLRGQAVSANITRAGVPKPLPTAGILSPGERHLS